MEILEERREREKFNRLREWARAEAGEQGRSEGAGQGNQVIEMKTKEEKEDVQIEIVTFLNFSYCSAVIGL